MKKTFLLLFALFFSSFFCLVPKTFASENILSQYTNYFEPELAGNPQTNPKIIEHGSRQRKEVSLTFDADMTWGMAHDLDVGAVSTYADKRIIDYLVQKNIKATVFLTGMWIERYPEETQMMAANPLFELANHSYSHPSFAGECFGLGQVENSQYISEIRKTQQLLKELTYRENKYFRFPGGCYNQETLGLVASEGMMTVHWDTVAHDGFNANTEQIVQNVLTQTQNGSIIVMHLGGEPNTPKTFEALSVITTALREKGYQFVTVSELLRPEEDPKKVADLSNYLVML